MFKTTLTAAALTLAANTASAVVLYNEDFSGQNGQGAFGSTVDTSAVDWTIDLNEANLFNEDDIFGVEDETFVIQDTNVDCVTPFCNRDGEAGGPVPSNDLPEWVSPVIDVSGFTDLIFSARVTSSGGLENTGGVNAQDSFFFLATLDGQLLGLNPIFDIGTDAFDTTIAFRAPDLTDPNVQIVFKGNTYAANERLTFDDVRLTGTPAPVPLPAAGFLLIAGLGGLAALRRRG